MFGRIAKALVFGLVAASFSPHARAGDNWAEALFEEKGVDFGAVPRGAVVRHNFVFTNRTSEILNVIDVRASCGCTTGRALQSVVQPGQSAIIEAQMDTRNFVGVKATTLTITLLTGGGRQAEVRLAVRSNILSDIVLNPGTLDFGTVSRGQSAEQVLTIDRHGAPRWQIERMLATRQLGQFIDAALTEAYRTPQGVGYVLNVKVRPEAPAGSIREEIRLVTNDHETPVVPVLVTVNVAGALTAAPNLLNLGRASTAAGPVQGRVLVRGALPFRITAIEGTGNGFEVAPDDDREKAMHVVTVSFHPEQTIERGELRRAFRLTTDLPNEGPLEIQAIVVAEP